MRTGRLEHVWGADELRPAVGWKVWRVDHEQDRVLLRSVLYGDPWPLHEPVEANCNRMFRSSHSAPSPGCECGVHAGRSLAAWDHYLAVDPERRVFGRVLLWGSLLEAVEGWRAALARPVEIFVPSAVVDGARVADGLRAYGVPVHLLEVPAGELQLR